MTSTQQALIELTQDQLTNEVQELNKHADEIIVRHHDGTTMHDVLQDQADERRKERERAQYNSSLANGLLQA